MTELRTNWEWALDYTGDPASLERRGELILDFLREEGLTTDSRVLNVGCGCLAEGAPLIRFLDYERFVGIEPNGWLVNAAFERDAELFTRQPAFAWTTDFTCAPHTGFDFLVAHSVFSHVAHWQLPLALRNLRAVANPDAVFLLSYRRDQYNSFSSEWVYPGNSFFRLETMVAQAYDNGWHVQQRDDLRDRLSAECPNDIHDWLKLTASLTPAEANEIRLADEAAQSAEESRRYDARVTEVEELDAADAGLRARGPWGQ